jgi:hypothetical protein
LSLSDANVYCVGNVDVGIVRTKFNDIELCTVVVYDNYLQFIARYAANGDVAAGDALGEFAPVEGYHYDCRKRLVVYDAVLVGYGWPVDG